MPPWLEFLFSRYNIETIARRANITWYRLPRIKERARIPLTWERNRLFEMYRKVQRRRMRLAGVPLRDAIKYSRYSPRYVDDIIRTIRFSQEKIADTLGKDRKAIRRGMSLSRKDWETLAEAWRWY